MNSLSGDACVGVIEKDVAKNEFNYNNIINPYQ